MDSAITIGIVITCILFLSVICSFSLGGRMMREQYVFGYYGQSPQAIYVAFFFGLLILAPVVIGLSIAVSKDDDEPDDEDDN